MSLGFLGVSLATGLDQADSLLLPVGFPVVLGSSVSISPFVNQHRNKHGPKLAGQLVSLGVISYLLSKWCRQSMVASSGLLSRCWCGGRRQIPLWKASVGHPTVASIPDPHFLGFLLAPVASSNPFSMWSLSAGIVASLTFLSV